MKKSSTLQILDVNFYSSLIKKLDLFNKPTIEFTYSYNMNKVIIELISRIVNKKLNY